MHYSLYKFAEQCKGKRSSSLFTDRKKYFSVFGSCGTLNPVLKERYYCITLKQQQQVNKLTISTTNRVYTKSKKWKLRSVSGVHLTSIQVILVALVITFINRLSRSGTNSLNMKYFFCKVCKNTSTYLPSSYAKKLCF